MRTQVDVSRGYGEDILSNQKLGTQVGRLKIGVYVMAAALVTSLVFDVVRPSPRPLLLDTSTGNIITNYKHVLEGYTVEERALLAELAYAGLRRRTGDKSYNEMSVNNWLPNLTMSGYESWKNLSTRWTDINYVKHGFVRNVEVVDTKADASDDYAFTIESIESEYEEGKPLSHKKYRVRLTVFFTDPKVDGVMKINQVVLHEESLVK